MRIKQYNNKKLLKQFEAACFELAHNPTNKKLQDNLHKLEAELKARLGVKEDIAI